MLTCDADTPPPKRTISQDGEVRKEYEEELRKVNFAFMKPLKTSQFR